MHGYIEKIFIRDYIWLFGLKMRGLLPACISGNKE